MEICLFNDELDIIRIKLRHTYVMFRVFQCYVLWELKMGRRVNEKQQQTSQRKCTRCNDTFGKFN